MFTVPQRKNVSSNKAIQYLKKAVSKLKGLKLPSTAGIPQCKPQCYAICVDSLAPIQIPTWYISQLQNQSNASGKIEILLYCSIFDSNESCFIGRTWKSEPFDTDSNNQAVPITKVWMYLKSKAYESKWIVIELVAQTRNEGVIINQISLGWTVIKLFANTRALIDVHPDENNNDPLQRESKLKTHFLFQGSPSYLLINNDTNSIPETSIKLSFRSFTFKKLVCISHLFSSETIIGTGNQNNIPSHPYDKSWRLIFDIKATDFVISSPILTLNEGFESEILEKLTIIRKNNFCGSDQTVSKIIDRYLNISFYNQRDIITTPTIIQLQKHSNDPNVLCWNGDIKIRVNANLNNTIWLLISLNYNIEWRDDPFSVQAPSHHHTVCVGRELINITSNKLILNGTEATKLILTPNYSWIDDCAIFNNIKTNTKHIIETTFVIRMLSSTSTEYISPSTQNSTKSTKSTATSFDTCTISQNPSSMKSNITSTTTNTFVDTPLTINTNNSGSNILPTPQGYVAMDWDDIKKQSLIIPSNVLQHKMDSSSKLGLLQDSFAVNTWQKLQNNTYPNVKLLKQSHSVRSLRCCGYGTTEFSPYDLIPNRKVIDIEHELSLSHQRAFSIGCNSLNILAKHLLLNPIQSIIIQLDFMGEKVMSEPIMLSINTTINNLRESLMAEDKYQLLPFVEEYKFEFNILPNQIREFIHFSNNKYAIFTIFNANTMFQIGSARLCLRDFLLQNNCNKDNTINENVEIPIICTKITDNPSSIIETQTNISLNTSTNTTITAKLCIQIIHKALDLSDTATLRYANWSQNLITNICDESGELCVRSLKLMQSQNKRINASKLYENPKLTQKLRKGFAKHAILSYPIQSITTKWKIPIESIHEISMNDNNNDNHDWRVRKENMETMNDFRNRKKQEMLNKLSQSDQFIIQPYFGQNIFFEIQFENPWNEKKKFEININDPMIDINENENNELKLVTNIKELSYLKEKYNVSTTMKRHLFERENTNEIIVNPQEKIYIPFKFQSFKSIQRRIINVSIDNYKQSQSKVIAFNISVEPIKCSIDRRFDIYTFENAKFMCNLPLPAIYNIHTNYDEHILALQCIHTDNNNNVAFEFDKNNENITFRCDIKECNVNHKNNDPFYFIIYNDKYCIDINEVWEINIYSYFDENCHGMLGGIIKNNIHLPLLLNDTNADKLKFFCDEQNGIQLELINNDNKKVLNIEYAPNEIGKKLIRIHCIDNENENIFKCLVLIHIEMPKIDNSFIIHIDSENDSNHEIITRKLPYNNGYNQHRNYELICNDPSIIRINNPILQIPSQSTMEFILQIMPKNMGNIHSKEVLLFVTECGNLEQCLRIEVKKGKLINL